jgi:DNA-binding transcriptional regulator YiaG
VPVPDKRAFPSALQHIGDHIKKTRLERKILIKDLITTLEINRETLRGWELGLWQPFVRHYPKIIHFLGYYPLSHETETLGGKIKKYRFEHGLTQKQFAVLLSTDGCTIALWEGNKRVPLPQNVKALKKIFS